MLIHFKRIYNLQTNDAIYSVYLLDKQIGTASLLKDGKELDVILDVYYNRMKSIKYCKYIIAYFNTMGAHSKIEFNYTNKFYHNWFTIYFDEHVEEYYMNV